MSHKPPTFSHTPDPLQADDWIKTIEKMLEIAQCTDRERVLYASGRLEGTAAAWWDAYTAAHNAPNNLCRVKTNRLAVLTVKSGLDPHMINELEDDLNRCFIYDIDDGYFICLFMG